MVAQAGLGEDLARGSHEADPNSSSALEQERDRVCSDQSPLTASLLLQGASYGLEGHHCPFSGRPLLGDRQRGAKSSLSKEKENRLAGCRGSV